MRFSSTSRSNFQLPLAHHRSWRRFLLHTAFLQPARMLSSRISWEDMSLSSDHRFANLITPITVYLSFKFTSSPLSITPSLNTLSRHNDNQLTIASPALINYRSWICLLITAFKQWPDCCYCCFRLSRLIEFANFDRSSWLSLKSLSSFCRPIEQW